VIFMEKLKKIMKISIRISDFKTDIQTYCLLNSSLLLSHSTWLRVK
jgi:hypothetical protein